MLNEKHQNGELISEINTKALLQELTIEAQKAEDLSYREKLLESLRKVKEVIEAKFGS